jgi:hypothetical protein
MRRRRKARQRVLAPEERTFDDDKWLMAITIKDALFDLTEEPHTDKRWAAAVCGRKLSSCIGWCAEQAGFEPEVVAQMEAAHEAFWARYSKMVDDECRRARNAG